MKREIKFRIKERDGSWHYFDWHYSESWACCLGDLDKETLCQFTGLKDKNGRDIYEGDILRAGRGVVTVFFNSSTASYDVEFFGGDCDKLVEEHGWEEDLRKYKYEVIGNIYNNPELLR